MNKKSMIVVISVVFMLLSISIVPALNTKNNKKDEEKISPLYNLRVKGAITSKEKVKKFIKNIKTKFLGENRVFYIPKLPLILLNLRYDLEEAGTFINTNYFCTCAPRGCGPTIKCKI